MIGRIARSRRTSQPACAPPRTRAVQRPAQPAPTTRRRAEKAGPFAGHARCSIAVHAAAEEPYQYLIQDCAPIYRAHSGRPHWGKLHVMGTTELAAMYPKWQDFQQVRQQFDPQGRMLNAHLRKLFANA